NSLSMIQTKITSSSLIILRYISPCVCVIAKSTTVLTEMFKGTIVDAGGHGDIIHRPGCRHVAGHIVVVVLLALLLLYGFGDYVTGAATASQLRLLLLLLSHTKMDMLLPENRLLLLPVFKLLDSTDNLR